MSKLKLFSISLLLTTGFLTAFIYVNRPGRAGPPKLLPIAKGVFLTSQLEPEQIRSLHSKGISSVIDIRPDGEAKDQPSSSEIGTAAKRRGMSFHYISVLHGTIPDGAVDALSDALSHAPRPAVLYCRTGRRAAQTFALAEASRKDGPTAEALIEMVRRAGFSAEELQGRIAQRISQRSSDPAAKDQDAL